MIHGIVGSLDYFAPASRFHHADVHTIDLLGYGSQRDAAPERLTLVSQVDHVRAHLDRLGTDPVWLLGHSMGGAVVMMLADRCPDRVAGVINVEGNFTLNDAFWSKSIAGKGIEKWEDEYRAMQADVPAWLVKCGVEPNDLRVGWAEAILANQPPSTLHKMSRAILSETAPPEYLQAVRHVVNRGIPIHLLAGERSAGAWDVPDFVRAAAASYLEQPATGHLMMLEEPDAFCTIVDGIFTTGG